MEVGNYYFKQREKSSLLLRALPPPPTRNPYFSQSTTLLTSPFFHLAKFTTFLFSFKIGGYVSCLLSVIPVASFLSLQYAIGLILSEFLLPSIKEKDHQLHLSLSRTHSGHTHSGQYLHRDYNFILIVRLKRTHQP